MEEENDLRENLRQVTYASMDQARQTLQGVQLGAQQLGATAVFGAQKMLADVGSLMPKSPLPNMHPYMAVRHGMYSHEMDLGDAFMNLLGRGAPDTTTAYEYSELVARDVGQRITNAGGAAAVYGTGMAVAAATSAAMLTKGAKMGAKAGVAYMAKRGATGFVGRNVGRAVFGGLGSIPGLIAYEAINQTVGKVMDDVGDRQDVMNFLEASSFRYMQGSGEDIDERFGAGFNRSARGRIAEEIKKIDLHDPRYNMDDLKGILEKGTELGMFTGTRDAQDFSQKFKDLTTNLKQVTKIMHQSLSDGMETLKSLKEMGITGVTGVSAAVQHADILGTATGRTAAEMLSIGKQGAEMVRGTGISLGTGSDMMQQTNAMLQSLKASGGLDEELIRQAGGIGNLSQQVMARHLQNLNSNFGRGAMMSLLGASGEVDPTKLNQLASGQMSIGEMYNNASRNIGTPGGYVDAVINRDKNLREITAQYGGMGGAFASMGMELSQARELSSLTGRSVRDTAKFYALKRGETEAEFEARWAMVENREEYAEKQQTAYNVAMRKTRGESMREMTDFGALLGDKFDRLINPVSTRVGRVFDDVSESITGAYRKTTDYVTAKLAGIETAETQDISDRQLAQLFIEKRVNLEPDLERKVLGKFNFREEDLSKFQEKSPIYKKMEEDFRQTSVRGGIFEAADQGADALAAAIFGKGKQLDNLTREETMFLESKARQFSPEVAEEIKQKRLDARKEYRDLYARRLQENEESREDAEEGLEEARDFYRKTDRGVYRISGRARGLVKDIYDDADDDPETARSLDDMIVSTSYEQQYQKRLDAEKSKPEAEQDKSKIQRLEEQIKKYGKSRADAELKVGMKVKDAAGMAQLRKSLASYDPDTLFKYATNIQGARARVDDINKDSQARQIEESLKDRLSIISDKAKRNLIGAGAIEKREDLENLLGQVMKGEELSESEMEDLGELAKESKSVELAGISQTVMDIKGAEDKITDVAKLEKFLEKRGTIDKETFDDPEQKTKFLKSFFQDNKLRSEELIQFELARGQSDRQKGMVFSGGRTNERIIESELAAMEGLSEVQQNTVFVLGQLKELAMQLERNAMRRK